VVLKTMASNTEQSAEMPMVKAMAKIKAKVIVRVHLESRRFDMFLVYKHTVGSLDGGLALSFKYYLGEISS